MSEHDYDRRDTERAIESQIEAAKETGSRRQIERVAYCNTALGSNKKYSCELRIKVLNILLLRNHSILHPQITKRSY